MYIGISGKATSGKDTVAKIMQCILGKKHGEINTWKDVQDYFKWYSPDKDMNQVRTITNWTIVKFGDLLKECTAKLLGCSREALDDQEVKKSLIPWLNLTVREVLQKVGDSGRQCIDKNIWVKALFNYTKVDSINYLIPDVRFPNEFNAIKNQHENNLLIRVERPNINTGNHISETALDNETNWDYIIVNDGTLDDLVQKVKVMIKDFYL